MAISLSKLVQQVKIAVDEAKPELRDAKLSVFAAVLSINAQKVTGGSAGVKWGPVDISGSVKKSEVQTLTLALGNEVKVEISSTEKMRQLSEELKDAIVEIGKAARVAVEGTDAMAVAAGIIEFKFGVEADGKIKVGIGGERSEAAIHSLKLTLKPTP